MSKPSTVQIIDPRIEPQPAPVYAVSVAPRQNQFYKVPASGISNSYVTFNNLTTLGKDRAYLDTFELEIEVDVSFTLKAGISGQTTGPDPTMWTFDSFPFNKCCDEARININGGAFFSQPLSYVRAKERYWDEKKVSDAYTGICPCHKPWMQSESGLPTIATYDVIADDGHDWRSYVKDVQCVTPCRSLTNSQYMPTAAGINSTPNNWFVGSYVPATGAGQTVTLSKLIWREPVFASPFSSRIDGTYGRPLYNITSIDLAFNLQDLRNMILCSDETVADIRVTLKNVNLCYQVETVDISLVPSTTVVPYRRFVPYVTDYVGTLKSIGLPESAGKPGWAQCNQHEVQHVSITSGVYTLNEVPTAIWIFAGPTKAELQQFLAADHTNYHYNGAQYSHNETFDAFDYNRPFGCLSHVSISAANTTQILNTAARQDLYRIAKANGLQDNWMSWSNCYDCGARHPIAVKPWNDQEDEAHVNLNDGGVSGGMGSVLRLIPGTDIVLQDQPLIPGSNANNMVFQVTAEFDFPIVPANFKNISLWLLFEYVGVASITPGQCQITMNPLGNPGDITTEAVLSANQMAATAPPGTEAEGGSIIDWLKGAWSKIKEGASTVNNMLKDTHAISTAADLVGSIPGLNMVPGVSAIANTVGSVAKQLGYGKKRPRIDGSGASGGARMGLDDFCQ